MKKLILLIVSFLVTLFRPVALPPSATPVPLPTPIPTSKTLTFAEMNTLYGPCIYLPTLIYHHVQTPEAAKEKKQTALTAKIADFRAQMQSLKDRGYTPVAVTDLINFFDQGTAIGKKSVLITLMAGNKIFFANHTWSHKNMKVKEEVLKTEIQTADTQLSERGLNNPKVFAYPYGLETNAAVSFLTGLNYKLAFTTKYGGTLCKKQRLGLPRIRIGNGSLANYGL